MIVHTDFSSFTGSPPIVATIGTFDGVHHGHRAILSRLRILADELGGETAVLSFYPHPRMILHPEDHGVRLLTTPSEKAALLTASGVDHLVVYPFSKEFSRLTPQDYVRNLLVSGLRVHTVIIGHDHRFGRNREGDYATLHELAETFRFQVEEIPAHVVDSIQISSTKIRSALDEGRVAEAARLLGYSYSVTGVVEEGDGRGRAIGFPTANIAVDYAAKLIPAKGVYTVNVNVDGENFRGVLNIGVRPTVHVNDRLRIEAHLFDFEGNLYGKTLTVTFLERIRDEQRFASVQDLQTQIALDIQKAREMA